MWGELAALGSAFAWSTTGIMYKALTRRFEALPLNAWRATFALFFLAIILAFTSGIRELFHLPLAAWLFLLGSGLTGMAIGNTLYIYGLSLMEVSRGYPIVNSAYPLLTVAFAVLFLKEKLTWLMLTGTLAIIGGVILLSLRTKGDSSSAKGQNLKGTMVLLLASLAFAVAMALSKLGLVGESVLVANFLRLIAGGIFPMAFLWWRRPESLRLGRYGWKFTGLIALIGFLDQVVAGPLLLIGIQLAGAAKAAVLSITSPLFILPLAIFSLRERVTGRIVAGTVLCVAGVVSILV